MTRCTFFQNLENRFVAFPLPWQRVVAAVERHPMEARHE